MSETPDKVLEVRATALYCHAYAKVNAMMAVYEVRKLKPGEYTQQLPTFEKEADWRFWKETDSFDETVDKMNFLEFKAYLLCIQMLLLERGYKVKFVPITQMKFISYVADMESGQ